MERRRRTIGQAVDECLKLSTEEWFRQHGGMRTREEALSEDVKQVTASLELQPGGRLTIRVGIVTKRRHQEQLDFYRLQRNGKQGYVQVTQTEASA